VLRGAALLALALAVSTGCGGAATTRSASPATTPPTSSPASIRQVAPSVVPADVGSSGLPSPVGATAPRASPPVQIRIPAIGVDSSLVQLDARPDGTLEVPSDFNAPGWYKRGPAPGELGPAIILGHLDSYTGPAVFWRLSSLHPGDAARIRRQDGSELDFRIQRLSTFSTGAFPTNEVYGPTAGPELRLITCGGDYSLTRRQYLANVVAFASLAS
jgi:Sortase domain